MVRVIGGNGKKNEDKMMKKKRVVQKNQLQLKRGKCCNVQNAAKCTNMKTETVYLGNCFSLLVVSWLSTVLQLA